MLESLHVKNLALIDEIEVEFKPGLNILTGETGAGKSILLGSLNLALGGRYSAEMLRNGTATGLVELVFSVENEMISDRLAALGVYPEEGRILLSRKLMEGRSVCRINGETVSTGLLKDVASVLLDIHGQHENQTLLHKKNHLAFLDLYAYAEVGGLKKEVAQAFSEFRRWERALEEADMDEKERQRELSLAEFEVQEIENARLTEGEDEELDQLYHRMCGGKRAAEAIAAAHRLTGGDSSTNASDALSRAIHALGEIQGMDEEGDALYGQLVEIDSLLNDFNRELAEYAKSYDFSEKEFTETESRLNEINRLKAKYGNSVSQILAYCEEKKQRLIELEDYEQYIGKLKQNLEQARSLYETRAQALRQARRKAALSFTEKIKKGLQDLNFLDVQFEIHFTELQKYTVAGLDEAEFYICTNPGETMRPLGNVASGGELSRIMLAVKTVLAGQEETPTLIFDEIDAGISGITAGRVAEKLHIISTTCQVICITHLAQIAALADAHYLIQKQSAKDMTKTTISCLEYEESIEELARLLGGARITPSILQSAREMKSLHS